MSAIDSVSNILNPEMEIKTETKTKMFFKIEILWKLKRTYNT